MIMLLLPCMLILMSLLHRFADSIGFIGVLIIFLLDSDLQSFMCHLFDH